MFDCRALLRSVCGFSLLVVAVATACAQQHVTVHVRVTESVSDAPLNAVTVDLVRFAGDVLQTRVTDSSGEADFPSVPAGDYVVRAKKPGYKNLESKVENSAATELSANVKMESAAVQSVSGGAPMVSVRTLKLPEKAVKEYEKGSDLLWKRKPQESLAHFDKAIAAAPAYSEAYYLKGMALIQLNSGDAAAMLEKSIELNARFMPPYYPLALLLFSERRYDEEQGILQGAIEQEPQAWQWPFEMARSFAGQRKWSPAEKYVELALSRPNAASKVHLLASDIYEKAGSPEKSVLELETFVKVDPNSAYAKRVNEVLPVLRREAGILTQSARQRELQQALEPHFSQ